MVTRPHRPILSLALFGVLLVAAIVVGIAILLVATYFEPGDKSTSGGS